MDKEFRRLIKAIEAHGFTVIRHKSGHVTVRTPAGEYLTTIAGTPSDHRSWRNVLAPLKRAGFVWPPHKR